MSTGIVWLQLIAPMISAGSVAYLFELVRGRRLKQKLKLINELQSELDALGEAYDQLQSELDREVARHQVAESRKGPARLQPRHEGRVVTVVALPGERQRVIDLG